MGGRNIYPTDIERAAAQADGVRAGNAVAVRLDGGRRRRRAPRVVPGGRRVAAGRRPGGERAIRKDVTRRVVSAVGVRPAEVVVLRAGQPAQDAVRQAAPRRDRRPAHCAALVMRPAPLHAASDRRRTSSGCRHAVSWHAPRSRGQCRAGIRAAASQARAQSRHGPAVQPDSAWKRFCAGSRPSVSRASAASAARSTAKSSSLRSAAENRLQHVVGRVLPARRAADAEADAQVVLRAERRS